MQSRQVKKSDNREGVNTDNSHSVKYLHTFGTKYESLNLELPRDRKREFQQRKFPTYDGSYNMITAMLFVLIY